MTPFSAASPRTIAVPLDMPVCQLDYPLDHYSEALAPYAEAYLTLPDRELGTVLKWMEPFMKKAQDHFGPKLLLLAHYYMGGSISKIVEFFGGSIGDSYQLALMAARHPEKSVIIESAVHFMAETISILAHPKQSVYITNPKSGCTMEMLAKDYMVAPAFETLFKRYGDELLPICYMNTSGRIKAMTGKHGGAVCTSSNVKPIVEWALKQNKKVLFIPDQYMAENVGYWLGVPTHKIAYWPAGSESSLFNLENDPQNQQRFDDAAIIAFASFCGVHSYYKAEMVDYWQQQGYHVIAHPECRLEVVAKADSNGSTAFIWQQVVNDRGKTRKYAVATENHMVHNLKAHCETLGIEVVNVGDAKLSHYKGVGCGCATMSRNDPPHLVGVVDLLRKNGELPTHLVQPGDMVNEFTGQLTRLNTVEQEILRKNAVKALEKMIEITESSATK